MGWRNVLFGGKAMPHVTNGYMARNSRYSLGYHTGIDYRMARGTHVYVPIGGTVVQAGWQRSYGNCITIRMPNGDYQFFAHLDRIGVHKGQSLKSGQYIGNVGNTGASTGPHLHVEIRTKASGGRFGRGNFLNAEWYYNHHNTAGKAINGGESGGSTSAPSGSSSGSGGGTTNVSETVTYVDDGQWGGMKVAGFSKKDFYAALESMFGSIDVLIALDKEAKLTGGKSIKWAIDQMVKKKITDPSIALTYLNKTAWFRKYGTEVTQRLVLEKQKPGVAKSEKAKRQAEIETLFNQAGVTLPPEDLAKLARNAWAFGWSDEQVINQMQKDEDVKYSGGNIAAGVDALETYADDYGVTLSESDIRQFRQDYLDNRGDQNARDTIQKRAAETYGIWRDEILAGRSVKSLAGAYFNTAANLLEVAPEDIAWDDPLFKNGKAFTAIDEKTGKPAQRALWDFEKEVRQDARWRKTKNARDEMTGAGYQILQRFGMVG